MFGLTIIVGLIRIHGLSISSEGISIRRYSAFGFKKRELLIRDGKLNDITFWEHGDLNYTSSTDTWLDIFFIPALFVSGKKGVTFKTVFTESNIKSFKVYLTDQEYQLIRELVG